MTALAAALAVSGGCAGPQVMPEIELPEGFEPAQLVLLQEEAWPLEASRSCVGFARTGEAVYFLADEEGEDEDGFLWRTLRLVAVDVARGGLVIDQVLVDEQDPPEPDAPEGDAVERAGEQLVAVLPLVNRMILVQGLAHCDLAEEQEDGSWTGWPAGQEVSVALEDGDLVLRVGPHESVLQTDLADARIEAVHHTRWTPHALVELRSADQHVILVEATAVPLEEGR